MGWPTDMRLISLIALALVTSACAGDLGGRTYSRSDAREVYRVRYGEVVAVAPVTIDGEYSSLGTVGGGAVGWSLGRVVGDGSGSRVAGALGGVGGAIAGREAEKALTTESGLEIMVDLDRGDLLVIVQSADEAFAAGERVRVLFGGRSEARVLKL